MVATRDASQQFNVTINSAKKIFMQQRVNQRSQRLQRSALVRRQHQLADYLREIKARRIQAREPQRSLCLQAQGDPGFRYIIFGEEGYVNPSAVLGKLSRFGFWAMWAGQEPTAVQEAQPQGRQGGDNAQAKDSSTTLLSGSGRSNNTIQDYSPIASGPPYISPSMISGNSNGNSGIASNRV
jgi:hypothetical protein